MDYLQAGLVSHPQQRSEKSARNSDKYRTAHESSVTPDTLECVSPFQRSASLPSWHPRRRQGIQTSSGPPMSRTATAISSQKSAGTTGITHDGCNVDSYLGNAMPAPSPLRPSASPGTPSYRASYRIACRGGTTFNSNLYSSVRNRIDENSTLHHGSNAAGCRQPGKNH